MDDLVVFLRARLAEDEQVARGVSTGPNVPEKWTAAKYREGVRPWRIDGQCSLVVEAVCGPDAAHIARHDPARVLAEVEAKRRVIDRYEAGVALLKAWTAADELLSALTVQNAENTGLEWALRLLALPFRNHPDYKPEWAPFA